MRIEPFSVTIWANLITLIRHGLICNISTAFLADQHEHLTNFHVAADTLVDSLLLPKSTSDTNAYRSISIVLGM